MDNQYKYPALPTVVPNSRKIVLDVPTVCNFTKDNDSYTYTINYPMKAKLRYVLVYAAKILKKIDDPIRNY
jgi:hypothetical protein